MYSSGYSLKSETPMLFSYLKYLPRKNVSRLLVDFVIHTAIKVPLHRRIMRGVFFHEFVVRTVAFKYRLGFALKLRINI